MPKAISERIPPHNKEAEISVLGAILLSSDVFLDVSELIKAEDFYEEAHKEIFSAMMELHLDSKPIDLITVSECLSKRHSLEAAGGRAYIASLADAVPTAANAKEYAKIIQQKSSLRALINAASEIVGSCYEEKLEPEKILDSAEQNILAIAQEKQTTTYAELSDVLDTNLETILEAKKNGGIIPGLTSGFKTLDAKTTGFSKSDFIIVAARPSMGKTAFALNIAQNAALKAGARVVIFSLEMSREQLGMRMLAMEARVDSKKLKMGDVSNNDLEDIETAIKRLSAMDITIDDTPGMGVMEIRNKCRRLASKKPIDLIVIDYLQMMTMGTSIENRVQEAVEKFPAIFETQASKSLELHMIGSLQTNKVGKAVKIAQCIQSLDRLDLLEEIEKQCAKLDKKIKVLLEFHTGEESKSGFQSESEIIQVLDLIEDQKYPHVIPCGFMTMAPFTDDEKLIRNSFITLRNLSDKLKSQYKTFDLSELSMGMSGDFEIAIEEGSTLVRVGTAIFGERNYSK